MEIKVADVAELVDARDLKSLDGNVVWVRVPPPAPGDAVGARVPPKRLSTQARAAVQVAIPRRHSIVPPHGGLDRGSLGLDSRRRNSAIIPAGPRARILFGASYSLKLNHLPGTSRCFPFVCLCHDNVSFTRSSCSSIRRPMSPSVTSGLHSPGGLVTAASWAAPTFACAWPLVQMCEAKNPSCEPAFAIRTNVFSDIAVSVAIGRSDTCVLASQAAEEA
jgi:hypothetical protein